MKWSVIINPTMYRLQILINICLGYVEFFYLDPFNLFIFLLNIVSHTMDFWPNTKELDCQQFSSEICTKFCMRQYVQKQSGLALGIMLAALIVETGSLLPWLWWWWRWLFATTVIIGWSCWPIRARQKIDGRKSKSIKQFFGNSLVKT